MNVHIATSFRTVFVWFRTCSAPTQLGTQWHSFIYQLRSMSSSLGQYTSTINLGSHL